MTSLVTETFVNNTAIEQAIRLYVSKTLVAVRLHIYKEGTIDSGTFELDIKDGAEIVGNCTISAAELNSIEGTYWHGSITFDFQDSPLYLSVNPHDDYKEYNLVFTMKNMVESSGGFAIDVCRDYEKYIRNTIAEFKWDPLYGAKTVDGITTDFANEMPLGTEIYTLR